MSLKETQVFLEEAQVSLGAKTKTQLSLETKTRAKTMMETQEAQVALD